MGEITSTCYNSTVHESELENIAKTKEVLTLLE